MRNYKVLVLTPSRMYHHLSVSIHWQDVVSRSLVTGPDYTLVMWHQWTMATLMGINKLLIDIYILTTSMIPMNPIHIIARTCSNQWQSQTSVKITSDSGSGSVLWQSSVCVQLSQYQLLLNAPSYSPFQFNIATLP